MNEFVHRSALSSRCQSTVPEFYLTPQRALTPLRHPLLVRSTPSRTALLSLAFPPQQFQLVTPTARDQLIATVHELSLLSMDASASSSTASTSTMSTPRLLPASNTLFSSFDEFKLAAYKVGRKF